jgi:hypothetical protein
LEGGPGSGTQALAGIAGEGTFEAPGGREVTFALDYEFDHELDHRFE